MDAPTFALSENEALGSILTKRNQWLHDHGRPATICLVLMVIHTAGDYSPTSIRMRTEDDRRASVALVWLAPAITYLLILSHSRHVRLQTPPVWTLVFCYLGHIVVLRSREWRAYSCHLHAFASISRRIWMAVQQDSDFNNACQSRISLKAGFRLNENIRATDARLTRKNLLHERHKSSNTHRRRLKYSPVIASRRATDTLVARHQATTRKEENWRPVWMTQTGTQTVREWRQCNDDVNTTMTSIEWRQYNNDVDRMTLIQRWRQYNNDVDRMTSIQRWRQ